MIRASNTINSDDPFSLNRFISAQEGVYDRTTATQQVEQTRQQILDYRNTSGVMVMVTHFANITEISGASPQEGEAVVIKADRRGNLEVVERIQDW